MPNGIKYNLSAETLALKKGNFYISTGDDAKGTTSTSGFWHGITPPFNGYTIYLNKASNGPAIYVVNNDSDLISLTNRIAVANYTTVNQCFNYFASQSDKMVFNKDYAALVTNGLVFNVDASFVPSYPKNGTTWYDISSGGNNGVLVNGPTYSTDGGGTMVFDGIDDYITIPNPLNQSNLTQVWSISVWVKLNTGTSGPQYIISGLNNGIASDWYGSGPLLYLNGGVNDYYTYTSTYSSIAGTGWHHLVYLFNNSTGLRQIYKDGVLSGDGNGPNYTSTPSGQLSTWNIGQMLGSIAGLQVYNRLLTSTEILQNYYRSNIVTENITHRWDFSNLVSYPGTGTVVKNLKGSVNATLYNGPTFSSQYGGYLDFDGSDDYMSLDGGNYAITMGDGNSPWTINAWVRTTTGADALGQGPVISNSSGGPVYSMMGVNGGKIVYWVYPSNINSWKSFKGNITINDGNWHMLTWVQNVGYSMNMYVDGVLDTTVSPTNAGNNNPLDIIGGSWASNFNGDIAEVQINTTAFTQAQVLQQFNTVRSRFGI